MESKKATRDCKVGIRPIKEVFARLNPSFALTVAAVG